MLCTEARISGARRLSSLTKLAKAAWASRPAASASADHSVSSGISSTSTAEKTLAVHEAADHRTTLALDQNFHRAVGQAQNLDHVGQRPHREDVLRGRLVGLDALGGKGKYPGCRCGK